MESLVEFIRSCSLPRGSPDRVQLGHGGVVGDQPVPTLIDQHDWVRVGDLTLLSPGGHGGPSEFVGRWLDVFHMEQRRQKATAERAHPGQMIVDGSGLVRAESGGDDVGLIRVLLP